MHYQGLVLALEGLLSSRTKSHEGDLPYPAYSFSEHKRYMANRSDRVSDVLPFLDLERPTPVEVLFEVMCYAMD
jgi:hypothetical protein